MSTSITAATGALSTGTSVSNAGRVTTIDGGALRGSNLFHSFGDFDLGQGDTARWTTTLTQPSRIGNVVNRVTGGTISHIEGMIDSTALPNAAFFFINPAGIVFGAGARVNVPGAAYFSSASNLTFADGATFAAATPSGSTLTTAAPAAFGFLGGEGDIASIAPRQPSSPTYNLIGVRDYTFANLFPNPGSALNLSAANITLSGAALAGQSLSLVAVGAVERTVRLDERSGGFSGAISLSHVSFEGADGTAGIVMTAGEISGDKLLASLRSTAKTPGPITITASRFIDLRDSAIFSTVAGSADGAPITVNAGSRITLFGSALASFSEPHFNEEFGYPEFPDGRGGAINISSPHLEMDRVRQTVDSNYGTAFFVHDPDGYFTLPFIGGVQSDPDVIISGSSMQADSLQISSYGSAALIVNGDLFLTRSSLDVENLSIDGGSITIEDSFLQGSPLTIRSADAIRISRSSFSISNTDNEIRSPYISILDSDIHTFSSTLVSLKIRTESLEFTRSSITMFGYDSLDTQLNSSPVLDIGVSGLFDMAGSSISSFAAEESPGPNLKVLAGDLDLRDSQISTFNQGPGRAGDIDIGVSGHLHVDSASIIQSINVYQPKFYTGCEGGCVAAGAGDVAIHAGSIEIEGRADQLVASITSQSQGEGPGGDVSLTADTAMILRSAVVSVSTLTCGPGCNPGTAGNLIIQAPDLMLDGGSIIASGSQADSPAGSVVVDVAHRLDLRDGSLITSGTLGAGTGGGVAVTAGTLLLGGSSSIDADTGGPASAGRVSVVAKTILLDASSISSSSVNCEVTDCRTTGNAVICASFGCNGSGPAADVNILADEILLIRGSRIQSTSDSAAAAGNVFIDTPALKVADGSSVSTDSTIGRAGSITIDMPTTGILQIEGRSSQSSISTSSGPGTGGMITISAPRSIILDGGSIRALGEERGANVNIDTRYFIRSSDQINTIAVAGALTIENQIFDITSATTISTASFIDASRVLSGQCANARASGENSSFGAKATGPYAPIAAAPSPPDAPARTAFEPTMGSSCSQAGAGEGIRTLDPNLGKVVLYP